MLEIGTGSGYVTALLAHLARQVTSIEINANLLATAKDKLAAHSYANIQFEQGDGIDGCKAHEPFEAIIVTGSIASARPSLERQLTIGGRMFVVIGSAPVMEAFLVTRIAENNYTHECLFETELEPLIGGESIPQFKF